MSVPKISLRKMLATAAVSEMTKRLNPMVGKKQKPLKPAKTPKLKGE